MSDKEANIDSDAPEVFTAEQGMRQYDEIRRIKRESTARVAREAKERRRKWAQKLTPRSKPKVKSIEEEPEEAETHEDEFYDNKGMLPAEIVKIIAAREKKVFASDSEDEKVEEKPSLTKRKRKTSGSGTVILRELPPPPCLQNSLNFLQQRKMQISRSSAVLTNSNQALRFLSSSGLLK